MLSKSPLNALQILPVLEEVQSGEPSVGKIGYTLHQETRPLQACIPSMQPTWPTNEATRQAISNIQHPTSLGHIVELHLTVFRSRADRARGQTSHRTCWGTLGVTACLPACLHACLTRCFPVLACGSRTPAPPLLLDYRSADDVGAATDDSSCREGAAAVVGVLNSSAMDGRRPQPRQRRERLL